MAEAKTNVELLFLNVVAGVGIPVDISVFTIDQIVVYMTDARQKAVYLTDYTVAYIVGSDTYRDGFVVTPTASMITKINATGLDNKIYVRRETPLTTEFSPTDSFLRDRIVDEFDKTIQRMQEVSADVSSAVRTPVNEPAIIFPPAATRALKILEFDADGKPITIRSVEGFNADVAQVAADRAAVAADRAAVAADRTAVDASTAAAAGSATAAQTARVAAEAAQTAAAGSATAAAGSATAAQTARSGAEAAQTAAQTAQGGAQTARTGAENARDAAVTAQTGAETARTGAETARTGAETARTGAETAQTGSQNALKSAQALYQGTLTADPALDLAGQPLTAKAYYYKSSAGLYRFYDGSTWHDGPVIGLNGQAPGQCRLVAESVSSLRLNPYQGRDIVIGGSYRSLPDAGVNILKANALNGLNYVYAYWTGSAVALEMTATAPVMLNGVMVKTGDATRTYVGATYHSAAGSDFLDNITNRMVRSHYNEKPLCGAGVYSTTWNTANAAYVEGNAASRNWYLCFAGETIRGVAHCSASHANTGGVMRLQGCLDSPGTGTRTAATVVQAPTAGLFNAMAVAISADITTTGAHFINLAIQTDGATATVANSSIETTLIRS